MNDRKRTNDEHAPYDDPSALTASKRFDVEYELRREWWLNHTHPISALYGDDGELQCHACMTDFKRQPIEELHDHVHRLRIERGARLVEEAQGGR